MWDPGLSSPMISYYSTQLLCKSIRLQLPPRPKDASFLGNSWTEKCVVGLTQLARSQGKGNRELLLGVPVRDWRAANCCCKPLSQEALASRVVWVEKILRFRKWISRIHTQKAQRLPSVNLGWRNFVPDKGHCKHSLVAFIGCLEAKIEAVCSVSERAGGLRSDGLGK